jgi:hypothetical protein
MDDPVTHAISVLNEALERDPEAITRLINMRVECNERLAAHPTVQVGVYDGIHRVGVLGLLNGALGESPSGVIGARGRMEGDSGRFLNIKEFVDLRLQKVDELA